MRDIESYDEFVNEADGRFATPDNVPLLRSGVIYIDRFADPKYMPLFYLRCPGGFKPLVAWRDPMSGNMAGQFFTFMPTPTQVLGSSIVPFYAEGGGERGHASTKWDGRHRRLERWDGYKIEKSFGGVGPYIGGSGS